MVIGKENLMVAWKVFVVVATMESTMVYLKGKTSAASLDDSAGT